MLLFYCFGFVGFVTTILDNYQFQSQIRLPQINVVTPIRLYSNSMQLSMSEVIGYISCSCDVMTSSTTGTFPLKFTEAVTNCWYQKLSDMISEKCLWKCFFATNWFVLHFFLQWLWLQPFSCYVFLTVCSDLFSHNICCCDEIFSTTNNIGTFWRGKIQQRSTYAFCSLDDICMQKWKSCSPNNLCKKLLET